MEYFIEKQRGGKNCDAKDEGRKKLEIAEQPILRYSVVAIYEKG
jgi:hypothetical protein